MYVKTLMANWTLVTNIANMWVSGYETNNHVAKRGHSRVSPISSRDEQPIEATT